MSSRCGRLNWSNIEVHISDKAIEKQHQFTASASPLSTNTVSADDEQETSLPAATKSAWKPKTGVGEMRMEEFVGNFMLTNAEEVAIDRKYKKQATRVEYSKVSSIPKPVRISNRLQSIRDTPLSIRITNLFVGQHLLNVFVCHVESCSNIYIMFGDDYNRATKLFQEMNACEELIRPLNTNFETKEKDLVALRHENNWFRGCCLNSTSTHVDVFCIDSGATITCSKNDKDRYEAIVTRIDASNRPTIVLYYENENVNDQLLAMLNIV
ncbi:unnamed protein product [Adineta ricciae]|uniref:Tudor domain-containing protein n=1 Tax=Adineta ricciae TaxID=249248 RepID=A0A813P041_ADIRI|nr:unnamed protein product [Adineta ricciae]